MKVIYLTKGQKTFVDDDLYKFLNQWKWVAREPYKNFFYASRTYHETCIQMHHLVCGFPLKGFMVDHINGNGLDNRKKNLRIVTYRENSLNSRKRRNGLTSSRYYGVSWDKDASKWRAMLTLPEEPRHIGFFDTEIEASRAYQSKLSRFGYAKTRTLHTGRGNE